MPKQLSRSSGHSPDSQEHEHPAAHSAAENTQDDVNQYAVATAIHYLPSEAEEMFWEACVLGAWVKIQTSSRSMGHTITIVTGQPDLDRTVPVAAL